MRCAHAKTLRPSLPGASALIRPGGAQLTAPSITHAFQLFGTEHSKVRKAVLLLESIYNLVRDNQSAACSPSQLNLVFSCVTSDGATC